MTKCKNRCIINPRYIGGPALNKMFRLNSLTSFLWKKKVLLVNNNLSWQQKNLVSDKVSSATLEMPAFVSLHKGKFTLSVNSVNTSAFVSLPRRSSTMPLLKLRSTINLLPFLPLCLSTPSDEKMLCTFYGVLMSIWSGGQSFNRPFHRSFNITVSWGNMALTLLERSP